MRNRQAGFTLIELLVVIAIIGLLASVIMVGLNGARKKARDARTKADAKQIITALEFARDASASKTFPGNTGNWQCLKSSGSCWRGSYSANSAVITALAPFMSSVPKPTGPSGNYMYDAYLYLPNYTGDFGAGPGTFLIYALERPFTTGECRGYYAGQYEAGYYYCYMKID